MLINKEKLYHYHVIDQVTNFQTFFVNRSSTFVLKQSPWYQTIVIAIAEFHYVCQF